MLIFLKIISTGHLPIFRKLASLSLSPIGKKPPTLTLGVSKNHSLGLRRRLPSLGSPDAWNSALLIEFNRKSLIFYLFKRAEFQASGEPREGSLLLSPSE